jgi:hypothetical protein
MNTAPFSNLGESRVAATAPSIDLGLSEDIPIALSPDVIAREATRYLVYVGDTMTPREKRERANPLGGEHYGQQYQCLLRSKGILRRCQITPLEVAYDFINDEIMGDNPNKLLIASSLSTDNVPINLGGKLNAIPVYPGDQIKGILVGDRNQDAAKGVVEVKALAGIDYADFKKSGIQELVFPEWVKILSGAEKLPLKLSALMSLLNERRSVSGDTTFREIIDTYLLSGEQYRDWGVRYLKYSAMLVRQPAHQGFVHTYSDVAEMLFEQLEVRREDLIRMVNEDQGSPITATSTSDAEVADMRRQMAKMQELLVDLLSGKVPVGTKAPVSTEPVVEAATAEKVQAQDSQAEAEKPAEESKATNLDPRLCQAISSSSGRQCQRLAKENGRCELPAHQPESD